MGATASHKYNAHVVKEDLEKLTSRYYSCIDVFCHGRQLCLSHWGFGKNNTEILMMIIMMDTDCGLLNLLFWEMMDAAFKPESQ